MNSGFSKNQLALAVAAAIGATAIVAAPPAMAAKTPGKYVAGDIHNHTTCSDGSTSMQRLVKKSTDKDADTPWGLDWFVQAGHGGNGNRNCTLVEDAALGTDVYPFLSGPTPFNFATPPAATQYNGPQTNWASSIGTPAIKGIASGSGLGQNMWRWQSIQEFQYPLIEYLNASLNRPLFLGIETVNPGHEHTSMTVIDGQIPLELDTTPLDTTPPYNPVGNGNALAKWEYCFDRNDTDTSRGVTNAWDCSVPGSLNAADPSWSAAAMKLIPAGGPGTGIRGHNKGIESIKWMAANAASTSYFLPTHLERAGPFNPDGNNGFNVEHLRNFNNAGPNIAFGFETQPGHHATPQRGEYTPRRNGGFPGETVNVDSVGGTTYGGTGVYGAVVGGVWDSMLGEGRRYWFFASSDWHSRGSFPYNDRRSTGDFFPGEYQRAYSLVRNGTDKLRPQTIVDGMRTGNSFSTTGQIIDRLAFVACVSYPIAPRTNAFVENLAVNAAANNTDTDQSGCATMGEKLKVRPGGELVISVVVRDPSGTNYSPYVFNNPSLLQVGIEQPLNMPVLDHIDLIRGMVTGMRQPGAPDYAGEWPRNFNWLRADGTTADLSVVPAAAKNTTAGVIRTFNGSGTGAWTPVDVNGSTLLKMTYRIPGVTASQYLRLRGTNLPAAVPFETDANGNPLSDLYTNASDATKLRIPCTIAGTTVPANNVVFSGVGIDGCPVHLPTAANTTGMTDNPIAGQKAVALDVAAWSDLWFYSNPIYVEVAGSTVVAGVQ
jgi:hypothetical protein